MVLGGVDCEGKPFVPVISKEEAIASCIHLIDLFADQHRSADI
jgi:hypothetical protein